MQRVTVVQTLNWFIYIWCTVINKFVEHIEVSRFILCSRWMHISTLCHLMQFSDGKEWAVTINYWAVCTTCRGLSVAWRHRSVAVAAGARQWRQSLKGFRRVRDVARAATTPSCYETSRGDASAAIHYAKSTARLGQTRCARHETVQTEVRRRGCRSETTTVARRPAAGLTSRSPLRRAARPRPGLLESRVGCTWLHHIPSIDCFIFVLRYKFVFIERVLFVPVNNDSVVNVFASTKLKAAAALDPLGLYSFLLCRYTIKLMPTIDRLPIVNIFYRDNSPNLPLNNKTD